MEEIPDTPIYCTANAVKSIEGQYGKRGWNFHVVKTGDSVEIGNGKKLVFVEMRMLHWPDSSLQGTLGSRKNYSWRCPMDKIEMTLEQILAFDGFIDVMVQIYKMTSDKIDC